MQPGTLQVYILMTATMALYIKPILFMRCFANSAEMWRKTLAISSFENSSVIVAISTPSLFTTAVPIVFAVVV
jgi:hypothetical protein